MRVVITGGAGFLGSVLTSRLVNRSTLTGPSGRPEAIDSIVVFDAADPGFPGYALAAGGNPNNGRRIDDRVQMVPGDISDPGRVRDVIDRDDVSVFHLASMVSAGCELDFDRALAVNLDGTRNVLEACRVRSSLPRLVFSSSIVAFGGIGVDDIVSDTTKLTPETTYGLTKAMGELLVNDYTRKGFVDGRSARLPTVVVRPGRPNAAASSWVSGIFREPLDGVGCVVPVDFDMAIPIAGYRTVVENLLRLHELDGAALGPDRSLNLPAFDATPRQMTAALKRVTDRPLGEIRCEIDPVVSTFFRGWARHSSFPRATSLGLVRDESIDTMVAAYIQDFLEPVGTNS